MDWYILLLLSLIVLISTQAFPVSTFEGPSF